MKFSQSIVLAMLFVSQVVWQVSAHAESTHKQEHQEEEHSAHNEKAEHDEHKHEEHKDEHEEHGSHEHGAAQLTIAVGDGELEIELETPAANVFGFEHKVTSEEDKKNA